MDTKVPRIGEVNEASVGYGSMGEECCEKTDLRYAQADSDRKPTDEERAAYRLFARRLIEATYNNENFTTMMRGLYTAIQNPSVRRKLAEELLARIK